MTLPEYINDHLIDTGLMSRAEVSDLITSIYNQLDKTGYNHSRDANLIDLLIDLESQYPDNELIIPKFTI
jgi:uncharacterized protein (UPF0297 family)